ncbi:hypothetical protein KEHDKFFH_12525 [Marinobacter maroccanus]|uniref:Uncharacterized protein n=1 Tax=Marinobacter maroccanus TaxID=2055143 RepID=A0A2S5Z9H2_9GAMM|nr:hypothetical protein [Marinobacter maroccanus]PPI83872.1 hypothetical protein KEHDKFFH_12525 [Marinobacter maroccanus]
MMNRYRPHSLPGFVLVTGFLLPTLVVAEDVPEWLSGPPETEVPECLQAFLHTLKETAEIDQAGSFRNLAEKRLANLVNRAWEARRSIPEDSYKATLTFLYMKPDGAPRHFRFQMSGEEIDRLGSDCEN